jgi:hypothetical protein
MNFLEGLLKGVPAPCNRLAPHVFSFVIGLAIALTFSYVLYRLGLPSKPFIYVSF